MTSSQDKKSPRVIMLLSGLPPMQMGGAEVQAMRLCRELLSRGVEVKVVTWGKLWNRKEGEFNGIRFVRVRSLLNVIADLPSLLKRKKVPAATKIVYDDLKEATNTMNTKIWSGMILRYNLVFVSWLTYLYFRKSSFDIIHVHMAEWPAVVGVRIGRLLKKPVVIKDSTMNGISNLLRYPSGRKKQQEIVSYAHFVAMTNMIKENFMKAGIPESRITMIPNGIPITPIPEKANLWCNKVVFIGNLTQQPAKGIDILLLAWKTVSEKVPTATLQIVGEGDLNAYRQYVSGLSIGDSVQFIGKQSDTRSILLGADVFVLPSRREGMSNALMEAMVCAMPAVVTNVSGSQDLVENGVSGLVVPPASVHELAAAMIYLLLHPAEATEMGRKAYKSIAEKCNIEKVAESYHELYTKILATAP